MSTEFITHLPPPGDLIKDYDRSLPPSEQPASIPQLFIDAMSVREEVFVDEQNVALERERDDDDPRCHHWVVYASVGAPRGKSSSPEVQRGFGSKGDGKLSSSSKSTSERRASSGTAEQLSRSRSDSTATRVPVGCIRLVPPPVPDLGSRRSSYKSSEPTPDSESIPHAMVFPDEPYIRLGRLATLKDFRHLGLAKLLTNTALQYARRNPDIFTPPVNPTEYEVSKMEGGPNLLPWNGLVYVHAQKDRTAEFWKRWGFEIDEGMGTWDEEGMVHIGMWKRLEIVS